MFTYFFSLHFLPSISPFHTLHILVECYQFPLFGWNIPRASPFTSLWTSFLPYESSSFSLIAYSRASLPVSFLPPTLLMPICVQLRCWDIRRVDEQQDSKLCYPAHFLNRYSRFPNISVISLNTPFLSSLHLLPSPLYPVPPTDTRTASSIFQQLQFTLLHILHDQIWLYSWFIFR